MTLDRKIEDLVPSLFAVANSERESDLRRAAATCLLELLDVRAAQAEPETQAA